MIGVKQGRVSVSFSATINRLIPGYCFNEKHLHFMGGIAVDISTGWCLRRRWQQYPGHVNHVHAYHECIHDDDGHHTNGQHRCRHLHGQHT